MLQIIDKKDSNGEEAYKNVVTKLDILIEHGADINKKIMIG